MGPRPPRRPRRARKSNISRFSVGDNSKVRGSRTQLNSEGRKDESALSRVIRNFTLGPKALCAKANKMSASSSVNNE